MKKLSHLVKYSLKKRIISKAFVISSIIVGIVLLLVTLLPTLIETFSDFSPELLEDKLVIVNKTGYDQAGEDLGDDFKTSLDQMLNYLGFDNQLEYTFSTDDTDIPGNDFYELEHEENAYIYIFLTVIDDAGNLADNDNYLVNVHVYNLGLNEYLTDYINVAASNLQRTKYAYDHGVANVGIISDIMPYYPPNPYIDDGINEIIAALSPMLIIPVFILITFGIQAIGADILDEKSTKAIEVIIASVKPETHFLSKIISVIIFQAIQMLIYFGFGLIGVLLNEAIAGGSSGGDASWSVLLESVGDLVLPTLGVLIIASILGATIYAIIGAFFAALSVNQEDYQQIQTPVMLILMLSYFVTIFAGAFQNKALLLVLAYIPFFSPMALPVLMATGVITGLEVVIGLLILLASIIVLVVIVAPLYKASILSYDQSGLFKRIKNTYRSSKALKLNKKLYEDQHIE